MGYQLNLVKNDWGYCEFPSYFILGMVPEHEKVTPCQLTGKGLKHGIALIILINTKYKNAESYVNITFQNVCTVTPHNNT